MHTGTVVSKQGFGHERDCVPCLPRYVLADVLVRHHLIGLLNKRVVLQIDLGLTTGCNFVMMHFNVYAHVDQSQDNL